MGNFKFLVVVKSLLILIVSLDLHKDFLPGDFTYFYVNISILPGYSPGKFPILQFNGQYSTLHFLRQQLLCEFKAFLPGYIAGKKFEQKSEFSSSPTLTYHVTEFFKIRYFFLI